MKRKIFKAILMLMVLLAGCTALWICAENSRHFEAGIFIFGTLFGIMCIWFYKPKNKLEVT